MTIEQTGRLDCAPTIPELVFERILPVSREIAWAALTESDRTARWIGSWSGDARPGKTVDMVWLAETGEPTEAVRIVRCEPPSFLELEGGPGEDLPWLVSIRLYEQGDGTRMEFRQQMRQGLTPAVVGTGWEFYLNRYAAALDDGAAPAFADYQVLQPGYDALAEEMSHCSGE